MSRSKPALRELARRELARRHFRDYLVYTHGKQWKRTKLSRFLADRVQAFLESETGRAYDILVLQTPPQHGKSMTITESLPSWWLGKHPEHRIILAAYNDELAERFLRRNREKVERFGNRLFQIRTGRVNRANALELAGHRGGLISRGIRSGITGNPAELIIIDDPIKSREEADSEVWRDKLWEEWQNSLKSRLAARAKVIVILTPWHEDDLAARILKTSPAPSCCAFRWRRRKTTPWAESRGTPSVRSWARTNAGCGTSNGATSPIPAAAHGPGRPCISAPRERRRGVS